MVKALVTGGTGFVGSHVARTLQAAGHEVRVLHRIDSRLDALHGLDYESAIGDILDPDALAEACKGVDWVFHVAAVSAYWRANDVSRLYAANVQGTRNVLDAARAAGVQRVIYTSSAAAVGLRRDGRPATETTPFDMAPHEFHYAYSKHQAERAALHAVACHGQDVVILNPVVVMGPGDLNQISGDFITQVRRLQWLTPLTSGGICVTDVRDVARWHVAAAERGRTGERYILGTANYRLRDWLALIADTVGVAAPFLEVPDEAVPVIAAGIRQARKLGLNLPVDADQARLSARNIWFDPAKAWTELGAPQVDMRTSLHETYTWYADNGYLPPEPLAELIGTAGRLLGR